LNKTHFYTHIKDWISQHSHAGNPNSILLSGISRSLNRIIHITSLVEFTGFTRTNIFPNY